MLTVASTTMLTMTPAHGQSATLRVTATVAEVVELHEIATGPDGRGRAAFGGSGRQWRITTGRGMEIGIVVDRVLGTPGGSPRVTVCTLEGGVRQDCQLETVPSRHHLRSPDQTVLLVVRTGSGQPLRSGTVAGLQVTIAYTAN